MAFQILLNFFLAFLWMFLQVSFTSTSFIIGYLLGLIVTFAFRRFFNSRFYMERVVAIISLILLFLKELILSNISVLKTLLKPKLDIKPGIFALPTDLTKNWEITLLANLITLTPGTLVVDISFDNKILYIHTLDIPDVDEAIDDIKNTFEKAIMEVSR
ncbi:Na+/H+ antiporter subunit E [Rossellomorea vietnamensis]|uniref:Na+/H+ antiporter subunit E n=2 Tax=Rossellomorea TaxID=2837508 RepID=A0A5D4K8Y8_9BACI|nr:MULTISPECIES: Na+/H+ antiporter subunit E [Rossellomorea]TYR73824.1 Na+/H+ antiporter subunit E [Rossellomorea vietnamensis]TYS76035.1 Na+/H+ antiporter subunit E [Rossellomorea aquimaris]